MENTKKIIWKSMETLRDFYDLSRCSEIIFEAIYYISIIKNLYPGTNYADINTWYDKIISKRNKEPLTYREELLTRVIKDLLTVNNEAMDYTLKSLWALNEKQISLILDDTSSLFSSSDAYQEYTTRKSIAELACRILDIKPGDSVLDLCSGEGNFLTTVLKKNIHQNVTGVEISPTKALISEIRLALIDDSYRYVIEGDIFKVSLNNRYDKIFSDFPASMRMKKEWLECLKKNPYHNFNWFNDKLLPIGISSDWAFIFLALSNLESAGKIVVLLSDSPLLKEIDSDFRKDLLMFGMIESIIKLPTNLFTLSTRNLNMVVLSTNNDKVKFVDASQETIGSQFSRDINVEGVISLLQLSNSDKVKTISNNELLSDGGQCRLDVGHYIGRREIKYHNPHKLNEFINEIYRGIVIQSRVLEEIEDSYADVEILSVGDIEDGIINSKLRRVGGVPRQERYKLRDGDVIITSKGTVLKVAVADNLNERIIIPTSNLIVIRLDNSKMNPYYLKMFLLSSDGKEIINNIQTGTAGISLNPGTLSDITISTMDIESQNRLSEQYIKLTDEFLLAKGTMEDIRQELNNYFDEKSGGYFEDGK